MIYRIKLNDFVKLNVEAKSMSEAVEMYDEAKSETLLENWMNNFYGEADNDDRN